MTTRSSKLLKYSAHCLILLLIFLVFYVIDKYIDWHRPFDPYSDILTPGSASLPVNGCAANHPEALLIAHFGSFTSIVTSLPHVFLKIRGRDVISAKLGENGQILFSADVYDQSNQILASIKDNQIHVNRNATFYAESPDRHSIFVYNSHNQKILDFKYLNEKETSLTGTLFYGDGVIIDQTSLLLPGSNRFFNSCAISSSVDLAIN